MSQEKTVKNLTPEDWEVVYNFLVSSIKVSDNRTAQYAASMFMIEAVFEFPAGDPPLASMRQLDDPSRKEVFEITVKELLVRAKREGYSITGTIDTVQWRSHARALSMINTYGEDRGAAIVLWHLPSPEGPMTFWIRSANISKWLKLHLQVVFKPKSN